MRTANRTVAACFETTGKYMDYRTVFSWEDRKYVITREINPRNWLYELWSFIIPVFVAGCFSLSLHTCSQTRGLPLSSYEEKKNPKPNAPLPTMHNIRTPGTSQTIEADVFVLFCFPFNIIVKC
jgi:hypothetical protein